MPNTYTELRTTVVDVATPTVTFDLTGISGYTDLEIVAQFGITSTSSILIARFNSDSGSNYSQTYLFGSGGGGNSSRETNITAINLATSGFTSTAHRRACTVKLMNYSNTTTHKTVLIRDNYTQYIVAASVAAWRSTSAITSITLSRGAGNIAAGSTFSLYGIANSDQGAAKATGGIITEDSQYWYHTFGASGAFVPKQSLTADVLVVAGGGGGSYGQFNTSGWGGGGGGAGGYRTAFSQALTTATYTVTVGAGGPGGTAGTDTGTSGVNSVFGAILTSTGGGAGSNQSRGALSGGSGGGSGTQGNFGAGNTPSTTPSQGNNGGASLNIPNPTGGGGGGGAGAAGSAAFNTSSGTANARGGAGGIGSTSVLSWTTVTGTGITGYFAGGGGGGVGNGGTVAGAGGLGGGGNGGASTVGSAGLANTGGGGGGAGGANNGGTGGSGIVIVRYAK